MSLNSSLKNGLKHPFKMSDLLLHAHKFGICWMIIFLNFITQFLPCLVMHLNSIFMQQKIEQIDEKCCCYFTAAHWKFYTYKWFWQLEVNKFEAEVCNLLEINIWFKSSSFLEMIRAKILNTGGTCTNTITKMRF